MNALAKSAMPSGMASMLKMFGVDPKEMIESAQKIGGAVKEIAGALERIERRLDRIEKHLGIEEPENVELIPVAGNGAGKISR